MRRRRRKRFSLLDSTDDFRHAWQQVRHGIWVFCSLVQPAGHVPGLWQDAPGPKARGTRCWERPWNGFFGNALPEDHSEHGSPPSLLQGLFPSP